MPCSPLLGAIEPSYRVLPLFFLNLTLSSIMLVSVHVFSRVLCSPLSRYIILVTSCSRAIACKMACSSDSNGGDVVILMLRLVRAVLTVHYLRILSSCDRVVYVYVYLDYYSN